MKIKRTCSNCLLDQLRNLQFGVALNHQSVWGKTSYERGNDSVKTPSNRTERLKLLFLPHKQLLQKPTKELDNHIVPAAIEKSGA